MRHKKKFNHLGRKSSHRKAMLANMATSLIMHKRIKTTLAKAKALRTYVEPLITRSKDDTTHSRRVVFSYLQNKDAVTELFREVSTKVAERPGGYTRILKLGTRLGDSAEMALIELVDYNPNLIGDKDLKKAKTTRRSRRAGTGKKKDEAAAPAAEEVKAPAAKTVEEEPEAAVVEEVAEEPVAEAVEEVAGEPEATVMEEVAEETGVVEEVPVEEAPETPAAEASEEPVAEASEEDKPAADENEEEKKA